MASVHFPAPHAYMCFKWSYVMEDSLFKSPTSHSCEVLSLDLDDEDAVFTEDFIKTQHGEFIHGMTRVYETLRRMQYIEASEIRRPPHRSLPREELVTIGLEPEAIALRQHLPFLEMHDEISYGTLPYNYLNDVSDAREVLWKGEYDLTPWTVLSALVPAKSARVYLDEPSFTILAQNTLSSGRIISQATQTRISTCHLSLRKLY